MRRRQVLQLFAREGLPNDKAAKQLKKINDGVNGLKEKVRAKQKDIEPLITKESDLYKKKIQEFEERLKTYQGGLKKEAYCFYISGLEYAMERINGVTAQLDTFDEELADLFNIATAFMYPDDLNNSKKVMPIPSTQQKVAKTSAEKSAHLKGGINTATHLIFQSFQEALEVWTQKEHRGGMLQYRGC